MKRKNHYMVVLVIFIFFVISFLTNILGPLIPDIIKSFSLSLTLAGFLPLSFFIAYGVMSIPSGIFVEKYGEKRVIIMAFGLAFMGSLTLALFPSYMIALTSLFLIGLGMAMLQVAINPLLREAGGEEHFAFNSVLAQLIFGLASFISPHVYTYLVKNLPNKDFDNLVLSMFRFVVPDNLSWLSLYWVFALVTLIVIGIVKLSKFPKVELKEDEKIGSLNAYKKLLKDKYVILFFIGIFCYVGTEQGVANWVSRFLEEYHGLSPHDEGASIVSYFWGLLTAGCLLGLVLLKLIDSKIVLRIFTSFAMIALAAGLFGSKEIALIAFPAVGFFASVMWSIIFSLALNSVKEHHGAFSGLLCTGIIGGAIVPFLIGALGDIVGLKYSMMILFVTLSYIFSIGFWAKPLINNATISLKKQQIKE